MSLSVGGWDLDNKIAFHLGYSNQLNGDPIYILSNANFTDTLLLKRVAADYGASRWRIDNVAYGPGGDLRAALIAAFEGY